MNDVMACMKQHVSVRSFTGQPIAEDLLAELLVAGQHASSSSFVQAYSVVRVIDGDKRRIIAQAAGNQRWIEQAAEFLVFCADLQRIQYCCRKAGQGELRGHTEHFITATVDTALMAQNVLLAAESKGLGGVFIGGIRNDPATVSECLAIPELVYPVFGLCLGWPNVEQSPKPRMPLPHILHQNTYREQGMANSVDEYDQLMADYYANRSSNTRHSDWSTQTARAVQGKTREHMLGFLQQRGFLLR